MPTCASNQRNDRIRKKGFFRAQRHRHHRRRRRRRRLFCRGRLMLYWRPRCRCNQAPCLGLMAILEALAILGSAKLTRLRDRALHRARAKANSSFSFFAFFLSSVRVLVLVFVRMWACEAKKLSVETRTVTACTFFVVRRLRPSQTKVNANIGWVSKSVIGLIRFEEESSQTFLSTNFFCQDVGSRYRLVLTFVLDRIQLQLDRHA